MNDDDTDKTMKEAEAADKAVDTTLAVNAAAKAAAAFAPPGLRNTAYRAGIAAASATFGAIEALHKT